MIIKNFIHIIFSKRLFCTACLCLLCCITFTTHAAYHGLDAYWHIETLPQLSPGQWAYGASSWERNAGNVDRGNFLYKDGSENVMIEVEGKGTFYRLWVTGHNGSETVRIYLDGASTPQIEESFNTIFAGWNNPFLSPLVADAGKSSGGYYLYLPISFTNGFKMTTTDNNLYYNIACVRAPAADTINTWTGTEDSTDVRSQWNNMSAPVGHYTDTRSIIQEFSLAPGERKIIADITGPRIVHSVKLHSPEFDFTYSPPSTVTDDGRAFNGEATFTMAVQSNNNGARIVRRMDYSISDQKADIYVDGAYAGEWYDPGGYAQIFYDSPFDIDAAFVQNKTSVTIRIDFISSAIDWNEFTYWMYSQSGTNYVLTDTLDVGTSAAALASEATHNYSNVGETWTGTRTFPYLDEEPPYESYLLTSTWLQATWDGNNNPAVNAPCGFFFGMPFGLREMKSLMTGVLSNEALCYSYFPMPFENTGTLILTNAGNAWVSNIWCEITHSEIPSNTRPFGYFHATYNEKDVVAWDNSDYIFLETNGCGHFVGVIHSMKSTSSSRWYLEGDERFYIDKSQYPVLYGTGTEDYYNGGWYFQNGPFNTPVHGNQHHLTPQGIDWTACYRLHLADRVPFRTHILAGIEHGGNNDASAHYSSVAYWYGIPTPGMEHTDSIDIANAADEAAHDYSVPSGSSTHILTSAYPGDYDTILITDTGRIYQGTASFTVQKNPLYGSLLLQRRADFGYTNQATDVWCQGTYCGVWKTAGYNAEADQWGDELFVIPYNLLPIGPTARVTLVTHASSAWTAYRYDVFSIDDMVIPEPTGILVLCGICAYILRRRMS